MSLAPLPFPLGMSEVSLSNLQHMKSLIRYKNLSQITALTSFVIGTLLFCLFLILKDRVPIVVIGMYYVVIAFTINTIVFSVLLFSIPFFWENRLELFRYCGILLLNIPIVILYFFLVLEFIDM